MHLSAQPLWDTSYNWAGNKKAQRVSQFLSNKTSAEKCLKFCFLRKECRRAARIPGIKFGLWKATT